MTRTEIRDLVVKAAINTEELTSVIDIICKEIGDAYNKGFNQGKYDPNFDNCDDDDDDDDEVKKLTSTDVVKQSEQLPCECPTWCTGQDSLKEGFKCNNKFANKG